MEMKETRAKINKTIRYVLVNPSPYSSLDHMALVMGICDLPVLVVIESYCSK